MKSHNDKASETAEITAWQAHVGSQVEYTNAVGNKSVGSLLEVSANRGHLYALYVAVGEGQPNEFWPAAHCEPVPKQGIFLDAKKLLRLEATGGVLESSIHEPPRLLQLVRPNDRDAVDFSIRPS